jgi:hypothetical protein
MRNRQTIIAGAVVASLGFATATALAQSVAPASPDTPQRGNPSSMPQGSRAGEAPGMNPGNPGSAGQGTTAQQVNPSPMPPGSRANQAPGMGATTGEVDRAVQSQGAGAVPGSTSPADPSTPRPATAAREGAPGVVPGASAPADPSSPRPATTAQGSAVPGGTAPGMTPGTAPSVRAQNDPPGTTPARPADPATPGTTGSTAGSTAPGSMGTAPAATGTTTPGTATQGGGTSTAPPAATTQHTEPRTAAAPVAGANSFTEGQARARIGDAGFNDVQELRLDEQGIWRGRAMRNGQQTSVALDYQGNVVATP